MMNRFSQLRRTRRPPPICKSLERPPAGIVPPPPGICPAGACVVVMAGWIPNGGDVTVGELNGAWPGSLFTEIDGQCRLICEIGPQPEIFRAGWVDGIWYGSSAEFRYFEFQLMALQYARPSGAWLLQAAYDGGGTPQFPTLDLI